jgi:hypothetical protein
MSAVVLLAIATAPAALETMLSSFGELGELNVFRLFE